jgi:hypothetical protein
VWKGNHRWHGLNETVGLRFAGNIFLHSVTAPENCVTSPLQSSHHSIQMFDSFDWKFSTSKVAENYSTSITYANISHPDIQEIYNANLFPWYTYFQSFDKAQGAGCMTQNRAFVNVNVTHHSPERGHDDRVMKVHQLHLWGSNSQ